MLILTPENGRQGETGAMRLVGGTLDTWLRQAILASAITTALSLSGCGRPSPAPDVSVVQEIDELLRLAPFGDATIDLVKSQIRVSTPSSTEAGLYVRLSADATKPVVVRFSYSGPEQTNLRLKRGEAYVYRSAVNDNYVLLGPGQASEALFYGAGPSEFIVDVTDISGCGEETVVCLEDGVIAFTPSFGRLENRLLLFPYQAVTLSSDNKEEAIQIAPSVAGAEYGVRLVAPQTSQARQLLQYQLANQDETVSVRSGTGADISYDDAERGWVLVSPDQDALLFSRSPSGFKLKDLSLSLCKQDDWRCKTHDDLKRLLPAEIEPGKFESALELLTWATQHSDYAISSSVDQTLDPGDLRSWQIYFKYYAPDLAGGFCGDTAVFFSRLLNDSGFESFTWNFGMLTDDLTHVTTIARFDGRFFILDPTFGGYFTKPDSDEPIEVFDLIEGKPFGFKSAPSADRDFIAAADDDARIARLIELGIVHACETKNAAGQIVCKRKRFGLDEYLRVSYSVLERNELGSSRDVIIKLMRAGLIGVGDMHDTAAMKAFAQGLVDRGIPVVDVDGNLSPQRLLQP